MVLTGAFCGHEGWARKVTGKLALVQKYEKEASCRTWSWILLTVFCLIESSPNTMYVCLVMVGPEIYVLPFSYLERSDFDLLFDKSGSYLWI